MHVSISITPDELSLWFCFSELELRTEKELYRLSCLWVPYSTHDFLRNKKEPLYLDMLVPSQLISNRHSRRPHRNKYMSSSEFELPRTRPRVRKIFIFELELRTRKFHLEVPPHMDSQLHMYKKVVISKFDADTSSQFEFRKTKSQPNKMDEQNCKTSTQPVAPQLTSK